MSSVYSENTNITSKTKHTGVDSQVSNYMNKAKGGGYSKLAQMKSDAEQREQLEKMELNRQREKQIMREKRLREKYKPYPFNTFQGTRKENGRGKAKEN